MIMMGLYLVNVFILLLGYVYLYYLFIRYLYFLYYLGLLGLRDIKDRNLHQLHTRLVITALTAQVTSFNHQGCRIALLHLVWLDDRVGGM